MGRYAGPPGTTINQITEPNKKTEHTSQPKLKEQNRSNSKDSNKTYSEAAKKGLNNLEFEAIWLNAKRPISPAESFPHRIEGLAPPIWYTSYINESKRYHEPSTSCFLCTKIDTIIQRITSCHKSEISPDCKTCQTKTKDYSYLNRGLLANLHCKHLNLLLKGKVGGEVRPLKAKAWSHEKNKGVLEQMKMELARFSLSANTAPLPSKMKSKTPNGETQNTTESSPKPQIIENNQSKTKTKNEKEAIASIQEITPTQESPEQNDPQHGINNDLLISSDKDQEEVLKEKSGSATINQFKKAEPLLKTNPEKEHNHVNSEKEAIQEITPTQEPPELNEPQSDVNRDPPISFGEDQEYIPCIDNEDPWLYTFYVGEPYP